MVTGIDGLPHGPMFEPVRTGNLDFTNPRTVDWWQEMLTHAARDQAWDGWMEDFGEYVDDSDHLAAGDGTRLSEVYPLLYHKITSRIVLALNPNIVSFARSGFVGTQQFPMLWGGDQSHDWKRDTGLPSVITAGITAGMSGYSTWGPDIISDGYDRELWLRWAEFGALTPVMRDHPWSRPKFSVDLWHDPGTIALFRRYAILHTSLLPYFATYAAEAHRTGVPILRHLVLEYPDDPRSADRRVSIPARRQPPRSPSHRTRSRHPQTLSPKRELAELLDRRPSHRRSRRNRPCPARPNPHLCPSRSHPPLQTRKGNRHPELERSQPPRRPPGLESLPNQDREHLHLHPARRHDRNPANHPNQPDHHGNLTHRARLRGDRHRTSPAHQHPTGWKARRKHALRSNHPSTTHPLHHQSLHPGPNPLVLTPRL